MYVNYLGHVIEAHKHSEKVSYSIKTKAGELVKHGTKKGGIARIVYDLKGIIEDRTAELA